MSAPVDRSAAGGGLRGWGQRLGRLLGRGAAAAPALDPDRPDLVVVASGFDDAEASSVALARAEAGHPRLDPAAPVVLRHHLLLPAAELDDAVAVAAQDGYQPVAAAPAAGLPQEPAVPGGEPLALQRVQLLDALHCSQERSRMAGLAQRRGGAALGWEALQPPPG